MRLLHRTIAVLLACVFAGFAAVQYNDAGAAVWVAVYLGAATYCATAAVRRIAPWTAWAICITAALAAATLWPAEWIGIVVDADPYGHAERAREALGLLIVALAVLGLGLFEAKRGDRSRDR